MLYTNETLKLISLKSNDADHDRQNFLTRLSNTFGFDYNKPFVTATIEGRFTDRSVISLVNKLTGGNAENCSIALVSGDATNPGRCMTIRDGSLNMYLPNIYLYDDNHIAYNYSRVTMYPSMAQLNSARKASKVTYLIAQDKTLLRSPKEDEINLYTRYKTTRCYVELDESGYAVGFKRESLRTRAIRLKEERYGSHSAIGKVRTDIVSAAETLKDSIDSYLDGIIAGNASGDAFNKAGRKCRYAAELITQCYGLFFSMSCLKDLIEFSENGADVASYRINASIKAIEKFCELVSGLGDTTESGAAE